MKYPTSRRNGAASNGEAQSFDFDVAIIGAGTAGMAAYREAAKYTDRIALIDGGPLGTTCARVGCMPSKLLIAAADKAHAWANSAEFGIDHDLPRIDGRRVMRRVRQERDRFVGFVADTVESFEGVTLVREYARFEDDHSLRLGSGGVISARAFVIATGSRPSIPRAFFAAGDRLLVNDDIFDWDDLPASIAVFGAGVIGLELGQALHRLGVRVRLFGQNDSVGPLSDPVVRDYAAATFGQDFPAVWDSVTEITREGDAVVVKWGEREGETERFDYLLAATGRVPNTDQIGLENTSLLDESGRLLDVDPLSARIGHSHVFMAGDAAADLPLLHEAADEGRLAGENAARLPHAYRRARRTKLGIVFTDPQLAMVGESYASLSQRIPDGFAIGEVSFEDQGRARVMAANKGLVRIYGERGTGRMLGAEMVGPHAEHLAHLLAWVIEMGATVEKTLQMPFYHPVLEEGLRTALRLLNHELGFGPNPPMHCIDCGPGA